MNLSLLGRCLFSKCQTTAALSSLSVRQLRTFGPDRTTNAKPMPSHQSVVPESDNGQEIKDKINKQIVSEDTGRLFSVVFLRGSQHKVTSGDLVKVLTDIGAPLGSKIVLDKVLCVGGQDFTLFGRPLLPHGLVRVEATVIERALTRTKIFQKFKKRENYRKLRLVHTQIGCTQQSVLEPSGLGCSAVMTSRVRYSSIPRDHERDSFTRLEPATSSLRSQPTYFTIENTRTLPNPTRTTRLDRFCKSGNNTVTRRLSSQPPVDSRHHNGGPILPDRLPHSASMNSTKSSSLPMHCVTDGMASSILSPADVSADDLASQLTLLDLPIFQAITPEELLSCSWNKKNKMEIAPNIVASTRRFNHVSFWTIQEILKFQDPRSRADIMAHFIKLARRLHDLNNLHSEFAILSALQSAAIYRLNKTWALLSKSSKQTFDKLKEMFSDNNNWGKLREHINGNALKHSPCIPYLGLFLTDLMMVDIAHPSTGGLESHQRTLKMNNILRIVSELQQSTYSNLTILPDVQAYLGSVRYIDELQKFIEDDQFKISLRLEPNPSSPPVSSAGSKESLRHHNTPGHHFEQHHQPSRDLPIHLSPICLSPSRRSGGCIPKKSSSFVPGHRKSRSEGGSILFGCGGAGLGSPDLPPHHFSTITSNGKSVLKVNSMDSLENEKQRSLLDGSLLDDPLPVCNNSASPIYSPYHENEALTSPDPLASFTAVQPGSVRTFQGSIQRKTLIKDGRRPLVASWQKFWLELWDTSLVYYLPKTLSKCRERRDFKSEPCKLRSTVGWIVMVPQQTNQLQPADQHSFQLADPVMRNVYRFRGEKKDRDLWVYHLTRATRGITNQCLPANLISFE